jgi:DNA-binding NarL/FixJ family response regulator
VIDKPTDGKPTDGKPTDGKPTEGIPTEGMQTEGRQIRSVRLLLVDDHPVVRAGLRAMFTSQPNMVVVGEASTASEAVQATEVLQPDVVVMDLQLGAGGDGFAATRAIVASNGASQVLILTTYDTDVDIARAIEAGALGYVLKEAPPDQIYRAVLAVANGETVLTGPVAARVLRAMRGGAAANALTARELEIVELIARGFSNREVARTLFVSEATIKTHLVHVYSKLGVDNRAAAVSVSIERRILRAGLGEQI